MKKSIKILIIAIFLLIICFIVIGIINKINKRNNIGDHISKWPAFSFATEQDSSFNSSGITEGPVLIVRYHPECEHCQHEISELLKNKFQGSGTKILLISSADRGIIIRFLEDYRISERPEFIPLFDTASVFSDIFGSDIVPSNFIYNKELNLVKVLHGEYKAETILKYLPKSE